MKTSENGGLLRSGKCALLLKVNKVMWLYQKRFNNFLESVRLSPPPLYPQLKRKNQCHAGVMFELSTRACRVVECRALICC